MSDQYFGWELLFNNVKNDIKEKEDVLMLLIHFSLIKTGFKCVGLSHEWKSDNTDTSSELPPKTWNADNEYTFRYMYNDEKYVLHSCHSDNSTIIFTLTQTEKLKVSNVMFNYEESVSAIEGDLSTVLPNCVDLSNIILRDLISTFVSSEKKNADTQTTSNEANRTRYDDPLRLPRTYRDYEPDGIPDISNIGRRDLDPWGAMGRRDLDPLASGGGMLFDPFQRMRPRPGVQPGPGIPQRLPRGAIPPGARFDPFGPPNRNPGPDRFPPEYDDMFS